MKREQVNEWWASLSRKRKSEVLNWLAKNLPPNDWIKDKTLIDWAYETMPEDEKRRGEG
jgi:hypothetical protein